MMIKMIIRDLVNTCSPNHFFNHHDDRVDDGLNMLYTSIVSLTHLKKWIASTSALTTEDYKGPCSPNHFFKPHCDRDDGDDDGDDGGDQDNDQDDY